MGLGSLEEREGEGMGKGQEGGGRGRKWLVKFQNLELLATVFVMIFSCWVLIRENGLIL